MMSNPIKVLEIKTDMWYTGGVIIRAANSIPRQFFLLSEIEYPAIIKTARFVIGQTTKIVSEFSGSPIANRAFFIGPYTTENAPIVGVESYGAFTKGMVLK